MVFSNSLDLWKYIFVYEDQMAGKNTAKTIAWVQILILWNYCFLCIHLKRRVEEHQQQGCRIWLIYCSSLILIPIFHLLIKMFPNLSEKMKSQKMSQHTHNSIEWDPWDPWDLWDPWDPWDLRDLWDPTLPTNILPLREQNNQLKENHNLLMLFRSYLKGIRTLAKGCCWKEKCRYWMKIQGVHHL